MWSDGHSFVFTSPVKSSMCAQLVNGDGAITKCKITKDLTHGFGINIAGGVDKPYVEGNTGFFVSRVRRDDLFDLVCVGDRIISVNGILLENKRHSEAVNLFNELKGDCIFKLERKNNFKIHELSTVNADDKIDQSDFTSELKNNFNIDELSIGTADDKIDLSDFTSEPKNNFNVDELSTGTADDKIDQSDFTSELKNNFNIDELSTVTADDKIDQSDFTSELKNNFSIDELSTVTADDKLDQSGDNLVNSRIMQKRSELFFFGVGACALFCFIYVGYRNFSKKTG